MVAAWRRKYFTVAELLKLKRLLSARNNTLHPNNPVPISFPINDSNERLSQTTSRKQAKKGKRPRKLQSHKLSESEKVTSENSSNSKQITVGRAVKEAMKIINQLDDYSNSEMMSGIGTSTSNYPNNIVSVIQPTGFCPNY